MTPPGKVLEGGAGKMLEAGADAWLFVLVEKATCGFPPVPKTSEQKPPWLREQMASVSMPGCGEVANV